MILYETKYIMKVHVVELSWGEKIKYLIAIWYDMRLRLNLKVWQDDRVVGEIGL